MALETGLQVLGSFGFLNISQRSGMLCIGYIDMIDREKWRFCLSLHVGNASRNAHSSTRGVSKDPQLRFRVQRVEKSERVLSHSADHLDLGGVGSS